MSHSVESYLQPNAMRIVIKLAIISIERWICRCIEKALRDEISSRNCILLLFSGSFKNRDCKDTRAITRDRNYSRVETFAAESARVASESDINMNAALHLRFDARTSLPRAFSPSPHLRRDAFTFTSREQRRVGRRVCTRVHACVRVRFLIVKFLDHQLAYIRMDDFRNCLLVTDAHA